MENKVRILGARGSVPVSGQEFRKYGGATTCILVELNGESILVDAGTGVLNLPEEVLALPHLTMLLTHPHLDHLLGLPMCPYLFCGDAAMDLYAAPMGGRSARAQVCALFSPPLWPVGPEMMPAELRIHDLHPKQQFGGVQVETMPGVHPGGVTLLRISGGGKSVVIVTDCTVSEVFRPELAHFAANCDLLLCDGQYSEEEWASRSSFGHSTWTAAAKLAGAANARLSRVIHHDPCHGDDVLDAAESEIRQIHEECSFAYQGEVIRL